MLFVTSASKSRNTCFLKSYVCRIDVFFFLFLCFPIHEFFALNRRELITCQSSIIWSVRERWWLVNLWILFSSLFFLFHFLSDFFLLWLFYSFFGCHFSCNIIFFFNLYIFDSIPTLLFLRSFLIIFLSLLLLGFHSFLHTVGVSNRLRMLFCAVNFYDWYLSDNRLSYFGYLPCSILRCTFLLMFPSFCVLLPSHSVSHFPFYSFFSFLSFTFFISFFYFR